VVSKTVGLELSMAPYKPNYICGIRDGLPAFNNSFGIKLAACRYVLWWILLRVKENQADPLFNLLR
jgi:hypothetical protein